MNFKVEYIVFLRRAIKWIGSLLWSRGRTYCTYSKIKESAFYNNHPVKYKEKQQKGETKGCVGFTKFTQNLSDQNFLRLSSSNFKNLSFILLVMFAWQSQNNTIYST
jgi:hypothetical protein